MKRIFSVIGVVVMMSTLLCGCGKDDEKTVANGIVVTGLDGIPVENVEGGDDIAISSDIGPDGEAYNADEAEFYEDGAGPEVILEDEEGYDGPESPLDDPELIDDVFQEGMEDGPSAGPMEGDVAEEITFDGPPGGEELVEGADDPFSITEDPADVMPVGEYEEAPSFTSSNVSASTLTAKINSYVSVGNGEEAPDGSKIWSIDNGKYNVDIQADSNGKVYSAYLSVEGSDKKFLADCASVFDSGAVSYINNNDFGTYEANGVVFELETMGDELCSLRITSKSYYSVLDAPM